MISRQYIVLLATISLVFAYQIGFKRTLYCLVSLAAGYVSAHFININEFSLPDFFKITKDNILTDERIKRFRSLTSYKNADKKKNIKNSASISSLSGLNEQTRKRATTSPRTNNKNGIDNANFELYFNTNYPWQNVYIAKNVEKSIEEFLALIIQNFILNWYSKISNDDGLIFEIKIVFRHILSNLIVRLKQIDLKYFATFKLNTILFNHISLFNHCYSSNLNIFSECKNLTERISKQNEILKLILQQNENGVHFALNSRHHELAYLRQASKQLLQFLLPDYILKCKLTLELVEEIFASNILLKGLDIIAEPDSINKLIKHLINNRNDKINLSDPNNIKRVQLLKHWVKMNGCIFKSAIAPTLKETVDNNELLHLFISYLNSVNSISILQFYLTIKELAKNKDETSETLSKPLTKQLEELQNWSQNSYNKQILETISFNYDLTYLDILNKIFCENELNNIQFVQNTIKEIHLELHDLIRDLYHTPFIKSDFMYKNLVGLERLKLKRNNTKKMDNKSHNLSDTAGNLNENKSDTSCVNEMSNENDQEMDSNDDFYQANLNENDDDDEDDDDDDYNFDATGESFLDETDETNRSIRLDLINEIKDEIFEDSFKYDSNNILNEENKDEDDDEDEDDYEYESEVENINLNNLRIWIDEIEEVLDKSNKTCFVFVMQVWNIQQENVNPDLSPNWQVKRKYDEFYVLDSKLKEFHGGGLSHINDKVESLNTQLPNKQRAMFFVSNSRNLEYLNSVKNDFAKYIQSLLANPILQMSQLLRSFLDPKSIEFSSSIFNDISNLGKIVKGVPYKLRLERGQSLEPFLMSLLQFAKGPKPKPCHTTQIITEDIIEKRLNNKLYANQSIKKKVVNNDFPTIDISDMYVTPFDSFIFLIKIIYKLPDYLFYLIFNLRNFLQNSFDYFIYLTISKKITVLTNDETIEKLIRILKELIFENEKIEPQSSENLHETAFNSLNEFIFEDFLSILLKCPFLSNEKIKAAVENGNMTFLEAFQYPIWNKNLSYMLFDALIQEMFPELNSNQNE